MRTPTSLVRIGLAAATLMVLGAAFNGVQAQTPPLEIPYVAEWGSSGHADLLGEPFNHWDDEGVVPVGCAKCHSTPGYRDFLGADGSEAGKVDKPALIGTVITCVACHNDATRELTSVTFPSGVELEDLNSAEARCMTCHQGRYSTPQFNEYLVDKKATGDDVVTKGLGFRNIHYNASGASRYGGEVNGGYEYEGKTYAGYYLHDPKSTTCLDCHTLHTFRVEVATCVKCHRFVEDRDDFKTKIRRTEKDFDGDGDVKEGLPEELYEIQKKLYAAILTYAKEVAKAPILYDAHAYPYFFNDKNGNGKIDPGDGRYGSWTPRLLKAAYNYQVVAKDPGIYTHNPFYAIQLMYDSITDLATKANIETAGLARP